MTIWTVGHSTHPFERFIELLRTHQIEALADVRRFPGSRRHPHFSAASLTIELPKVGIAYHPFVDLGGRRKPKPDSRNTAWKHPAFRGYADYRETPEFEGAINRLLELAASRRTAIMCAEAYWGSCHRSIISDYLKAAGHQVLHIGSSGEATEHPYTKVASVVDGKPTYAEPDLFS